MGRNVKSSMSLTENLYIIKDAVKHLNKTPFFIIKKLSEDITDLQSSLKKVLKERFEKDKSLYERFKNGDNFTESEIDHIKDDKLEKYGYELIEELESIKYKTDSIQTDLEYVEEILNNIIKEIKNM